MLFKVSAHISVPCAVGETVGAALVVIVLSVYAVDVADESAKVGVSVTW